MRLICSEIKSDFIKVYHNNRDISNDVIVYELESTERDNNNLIIFYKNRCYKSNLLYKKDFSDKQYAVFKTVSKSKYDFDVEENQMHIDREYTFKNDSVYKELKYFNK